MEPHLKPWRKVYKSTHFLKNRQKINVFLFQAIILVYMKQIFSFCLIILNITFLAMLTHYLYYILYGPNTFLLTSLTNLLSTIATFLLSFLSYLFLCLFEFFSTSCCMSGVGFHMAAGFNYYPIYKFCLSGFLIQFCQLNITINNCHTSGMFI